MGGALARIAALLFATYAFIAAAGLYGALVSLRGEAAGLGTTAVGLTGSAYFAGFLAGCVATPRLILRSGHIRTFAAGGAAAGISPLLVLLSDDPVAWGAARLVGGFAVAMIYTAVESWVNDAAENRFRGSMVALYMMVTQLGNISGNALVALDGGRAGEKVFLLASILFLISVVPVSQTRSANPGAPNSIRPDLRGLWRRSPASFTGAMVNGATNSAMWIVGPLHISRVHGPEAVGILMPLFVLGGLLGQWPVGRLSDRIDRRRAMALSAALAVAGSVLLMLLGGAGTAAAGVGFLLLGAGVMSSYAVAAAHANDRGEKADAVPIASSMLLLYGASAIVGPPVAAAALDALPGVLAHGIFARPADFAVVGRPDGSAEIIEARRGP